MPFKKNVKMNMGYAFIGFAQAAVATQFQSVLDGYSFQFGQTARKIVVARAMPHDKYSHNKAGLQ